MTTQPEIYPLTPMQQGMLFHSVSDPASDLYVEQLSCELTGDLDPAAFHAAWTQLLARHSALRTAFAWKDLPEPLQIVAPTLPLPFETEDWSERTAAQQSTDLEALRTNARLKGFSLNRPPLMRLHLIRLGPRTHHFLWTWHHILLDAWSVPIVLEDFFTLYQSHQNGSAPNLPEPQPFRNFLRWNRTLDSQPAQSFWRDHLAGFHDPTPLPRGVTSEAGYGLEFLQIPANEVEAIQSAARQLSLSPYNLFQAAWALLLSRHSGREEVVFGAAVSGRPPALPGVERIVGLLINSIPVRARVEPGTTVGSFLKDLQTDQYASQPHEHASLRDIQTWSGVQAPAALFESLLVFDNTPLDTHHLRSQHLAVSSFNFVERANFPVTVMMEMREQSRLGIGFDTARLDANTARSLLTQLRNLFLEIAAEPSRTLAKIHVSGLPTPALAPAPSRLIHTIFEDQAQLTPNAPAAIFHSPSGDDQTLTYSQLNAHANAFARHLQTLGVGIEDRVALCLDSGLPALMAILATLKAGAAYVPFDSATPAALLKDLIADCGARIILAAPRLLNDLSDLNAIAMSEDLPTPDPINLSTTAQPGNLAYLIYTSGSTGRRKAVAVTHASLQRLVESQVPAFQITAESRVLQFSSLSFDASVSEIFTTLLTGATLYLAPRATLVPSTALIDLMNRWRITTVTFPPSVLAALPPASLPNLQVLVSAGESCSSDLVSRWAPGHTFVNAYGPTECTVCATLGEVRAASHKPSIGRACGPTRIYLLDHNLDPVPSGSLGELYVGGPGVARGYWNRPTLTSAAFLPDPFSKTPGARMYRTGDLARRLPNGDYEFAGRADDQVKIRGFRIEPGEIAATLRTDPSIADAAVIPVSDPADPASQRLAAYIVPRTPPAKPEWWPSLAEYLVYDELAYHAMTTDERRNQSYRAALAAAVPGRVVLDVGTGPEALLARLCLEAGAARVYAIELLEDTFLKAQRRVRELGLENRLHLIHGDATQVQLPELADVCVSEIVGALGGSEGATVILNSVRRLLKPDAAVIPARSRTLYAPVELDADLFANPGFAPLPARYVEKIFEQVGRPFDLRLSVKGLKPSHLLAPPQPLEDLDFTARVPVDQSYPSSFTITRPGRMHGFIVWLTLDTGAGELIDILEHEHCWLPVFFPVFDPGHPVAPGDTLHATAGYRLNPDRLHPDYHIEGALTQSDGTTHPIHYLSEHNASAFRASPFYDRFFANDTIPTLAKPPASTAFNIEATRERLRQALPSYMVPATFSILDRLPLTTSGKLDRAALPQPAGSAPAAIATPSLSQTERMIAGIWQELLNLDRVDPNTNFFEHGGHSLMLLRVQGMLQQRAQIDIPATDLFRYPTIETLARHLNERSTPKPQPAVQPAVQDRALSRQNAIAAKAALKQRAKQTFKEPLKTIMKETFRPHPHVPDKEPEA